MRGGVVAGGGGVAVEGEGNLHVAAREREGEGVSGFLNAGKGGEAGLELLGELKEMGVLEAFGRHTDAEGEEVLRVEAGIGGEEFGEGAKEEAGGDEEDEAEGGFADDEGGVKAVLRAAGRGGAGGIAEGEGGVQTGRAPGGEHAEEEAGEERGGEGEEEDVAG